MSGDEVRVDFQQLLNKFKQCESTATSSASSLAPRRRIRPHALPPKAPVKQDVTSVSNIAEQCSTETETRNDEKMHSRRSSFDDGFSSHDELSLKGSLPSRFTCTTPNNAVDSPVLARSIPVSEMQRIRGVSDESESSSRKSSVTSRKSSVRTQLDRLRRRTTSLLSRSFSGDDNTVQFEPAPRATSRSFDNESLSYQSLSSSAAAPLPSLSELITSALEGADSETSQSSNQSNSDAVISSAIIDREGSIDSGHTTSACDTITPPPPLPTKPPRMRWRLKPQQLQDIPAPGFMSVGKLQEKPQHEMDDDRKANTVRPAHVIVSRTRTNDAPPPPHWSQPWFHGFINRAEAERRLLEAPSGSFLVREKEGGGDMPFVLSATGYDGKVYHSGIRQVFGGRYILGRTAKPQAEQFTTICKLVAYYRKECVPLMSRYDKTVNQMLKLTEPAKK